MTGGVQLTLGGLPLDPTELASLSAFERGRIYRALGLDDQQIACAEEATRQVIVQRYRRRAG